MPCIPGIRCAKAQGSDDVRDILGHVDIRVTQNVYTQFDTIDGTQDGFSYC